MWIIQWDKLEKTGSPTSSAGIQIDPASLDELMNQKPMSIMMMSSASKEGSGHFPDLQPHDSGFDADFNLLFGDDFAKFDYDASLTSDSSHGYPSHGGNPLHHRVPSQPHSDFPPAHSRMPPHMDNQIAMHYGSSSYPITQGRTDYQGYAMPPSNPNPNPNPSGGWRPQEPNEFFEHGGLGQKRTRGPSDFSFDQPLKQPKKEGL